MDSDFNFRPQRQDPGQRPDNNQSVGDQQQFQPAQQDQSGQQPVQSELQRQSEQPGASKKGGAAKKMLAIFSALLLAALVGGGVWYWQQMDVSKLAAERDSLQQKISSLEAAATTPSKADKAVDLPAAASPAPTSTNIITGSYTSVPGDANPHRIDLYYLPGEVQEIWTEYGTKPDALTASTKHITEKLGVGTAGQYGVQTFFLTDIKAGENYFYRAAAKVDGKTVYGGTAGFTALK